MVQITSITAAAAAVWLAALATAMYPKSSPVLQVDAKNYQSLIAKSNHTSIVEFYAPWCGHCQNLKPAYEKAAKNLQGLAKVAAVDCDDAANKQFCGSMGVQGFPTLKIVKPSKKAGRPTIEDYQGQRTAKAIVDTVVDRIPNHVKRIGDKTFTDWLGENNSTAKAILFTQKGTTSALLRALAVDFLGSINFGQVRDKETKSVGSFGITKFPSLVLLPGGEKEAVVYEGEMKKDKMVQFLSQVASPNPDPAPPKAKPSKKEKDKDKTKASKDSAAFEKASASHKAAESEKGKATATDETLEDTNPPTESPNPNVVNDDTPPPIDIPEGEIPPPPMALETELSLQNECLNSKAGTCVLLLLPTNPTMPQPGIADAPPDDMFNALMSVADIQQKHRKRGATIFPFYALPGMNEGNGRLREVLKLTDGAGVEIIATNGKRAWWKRFEGEGTHFAKDAVEAWVDALRMGEGEKRELPESVLLKREEMEQETESKKEPAVEDVPKEKPDEHDEL